MLRRLGNTTATQRGGAVRVAAAASAAVPSPSGAPAVRGLGPLLHYHRTETARRNASSVGTIDDADLTKYAALASEDTDPQPSIEKLAAAAVGTVAAMRYLDPACIVVATDRLVAKDKPDAPSLVKLRTALWSPFFAPWTKVEELADTVGIVNGTGGSGKTSFMLTARPTGVKTLVTFFVVAGDVARWIKNCHCSADEWSTMAPLLQHELARSEAMGNAVREALVAAVSDATARLANGAEIGSPGTPDAAAAVRVRVAIDDASECPALTSAVMTQQAAIRDAVRRVCKLPPSSHVDLMVGGRGILGRSNAISICADKRFKF